MSQEEKLEELKRAVEELPERDAKSFLFMLLFRLNQVKEIPDLEVDLVKDFDNMIDSILTVAGKKHEAIDKNIQMVHVVFGDSAAGSLNVALKQMKVRNRENVISFWDIFSIGPIQQLHAQEGQKARQQWMKQVCNDEADEIDVYMQRFQATIQKINSIPKNVPITIWIAENAHEQTGLRYMIYLLKNKSHEIRLINTTRLVEEYLNRPDLTYFNLHTGELSPENLHLFYDVSRDTSVLASNDRKQLENEWVTLSQRTTYLRLWRNGKMEDVNIDYYDEYLINLAKKLHQKRGNGFIKSARLIGEAIGHLDQYVGDAFLEYRLRTLVEKGVFEFEGNLKAMRFYSVRLKNQG